MDRIAAARPARQPNPGHTNARVGDLGSRTAAPLFVSGSAIGYYGDRQAEPLTEDAPPGGGFLADLCVEWEAEANNAARAGVRIVTLRSGIALERSGGSLPG